MLHILSIMYVAAVKVNKKTAPNGKHTIYLSKRDFVDHIDHTDIIDGVVVVENDYLKGRKVYGQLCIMYRLGSEEDEVMGHNLSNQMILINEQIVPSGKNSNKDGLTHVQERLIKKYGDNAFPFAFKFPELSPASVTIQSGKEDNGKPVGVQYIIRTFVGETEEDRGHRRSSTHLTIKKIQNVPRIESNFIPSSCEIKNFRFSHGKMCLDVSLDKEIYNHGDKIAVNIEVTNNSHKTAKNIKIYVVQHCLLTMANCKVTRKVAQLKTREGCPVIPGASLNKVFYLLPLASRNKDIRGVALDGYLKDEDVNLASSTVLSAAKAPSDALGIVVSYTLRVKLNCGSLGGFLVTDVPFKLLKPALVCKERQKIAAVKKTRCIETISNQENKEDNIIFEDFLTTC